MTLDQTERRVLKAAERLADATAECEGLEHWRVDDRGRQRCFRRLLGARAAVVMAVRAWRKERGE